ncbi:MAG TPA: hypothetical protein VIK21_08500, partial [Desulfuromonadaceae bacterium]
SSIAGSLLLMRAGQTQQALSTALIKQAEDLQNKMADMLAQNAQQAPQPTANSDGSFNFSTYA